MKNIAILSHVPLWTSHHAEAVEIALKEAKQNNVIVYGCNKNLLGCPANPNQKKLSCFACRAQTNKTNKLLHDHGVKTVDINLSNLKIDITDIEFRNITDLYEFKYKDVPIGRLVYSTIVGELHDSFFQIKENQHKINTYIRNSICLYVYFKNELETKHIEKLYVWNGRRSIDGSVLYAAKKNGIKYCSFISGGAYNSILVRENCETINDINAASEDQNKIAKQLIIPESQAKLSKQGLDYLFRNESYSESLNMNNMGFYNFHKNFSNSNDFTENLKGKKFITLFMGTFFEFVGIPGFDTKDTFFGSFYDAVKYLNSGELFNDDLKLVIRWHPNSVAAKGNERKIINELIETSSENVIHIPPKSNMDSYWLIENSHKVISIGSSIVMESAVRGKPSAFIGHNLFEKLDAFVTIQSWLELEEFIQNGQITKNYLKDSIVWGVYFSTFGTMKFEILQQIKPGSFYLNNVSIVPFFITNLKKIRKLMIRIINVTKQ
jgi:hypothetical protein